MEIITCEFCGKSLQVPPSAYGQMVQCPMCKNTFQVQAPTTFQAQAPPPMPVRGEEYAERLPPPDRWDEEDLWRRPGVPHRGTTILVMGILSILCIGFIFGPIAWIMGNYDLREISAGRMDKSGEGLTRAGQILGIVGTILGILQLIYFVFVFIAIVAGMGRF